MSSPSSSNWRVRHSASEVVCGPGALEALPEAVEARSLKRVLIVTDPGIRSVGHVERAERLLDEAGIAFSTFDGVEENPEEKHVALGVDAARSFGPDCIVGLGGGSSMDCAKGINFVLSNGGRMEDYWGDGKATRPMLSSFGVPCTAGTGSEAQRFALISRPTDHVKMACGDEKARFEVVILDPDLPRTAPTDVIAQSGMDAVSHAVETAVTLSRNGFSICYSREAFRLLERSLLAAVGGARDSQTWTDMLVGAHLARAAIEASMLGAAHAAANPLTARFGVVHGAAVGLMLPAVVRFNSELDAGIYDALLGVSTNSDTSGGRRGADSAASSSSALVSRLEDLQRATGLPSSLSDVDVREDALDELANDAAGQWTAQHNPRPVGQDDFARLYRAVL